MGLILEELRKIRIYCMKSNYFQLKTSHVLERENRSLNFEISETRFQDSSPSSCISYLHRVFLIPKLDVVSRLF